MQTAKSFIKKGGAILTNQEILSHIDHTCLKADAKWENIAKLCREAETYGTASVCIPQYYVKRVKSEYPTLNVCTVIGFPLGYTSTEAKVFETQQSLKDGADEIDMVINIAALKNGDDAFVLDDICAIREACKGKILKVIVETCLLSDDEKVRICEIITKSGADYIKTSTGFSTAGANLDDIAIFKEHIGSNVKIKAAGGIRTKEQMEAFLVAGCDRLGCSSASVLF